MCHLPWGQWVTYLRKKKKKNLHSYFTLLTKAIPDGLDVPLRVNTESLTNTGRHSHDAEQGVKLVFPRSHIGLVVAFQGPNAEVLAPREGAATLTQP